MIAHSYKRLYSKSTTIQLKLLSVYSAVDKIEIRAKKILRSIIK